MHAAAFQAETLSAGRQQLCMQLHSLAAALVESFHRACSCLGGGEAFLSKTASARAAFLEEVKPS